ncbi:MAG: class I SAM-dependent methyltransferase [Anaerolineales bacterium]|nr:class I SAM-dependent methyltransferase [Anaerolineales bacterium]
MDHHDHVNLIKPANLDEGGSWADLGAGSGAFTFALREVAGSTASIHVVDKDRSSLSQLEREFQSRFGSIENLHIHTGDFSRPLDLPPLDGVIAANSLHYFKNKVKVLQHIKSLLKPGGKLIVIEYNVDSGNPWVPYPFSFPTFRKLALDSGFAEPRLLATHPSRFLREFYSALNHS